MTNLNAYIRSMCFQRSLCYLNLDYILIRLVMLCLFIDVFENDSQCCEKEATDLSKDSEELTPTNHNYYF